MAQLRPFPGLRADDALAGEIIAPPYDVVSEAEAKAIAGPNPKSFLHVTRPDVDLAPGVDIHSAVAYEKARENLDSFTQRGWIVQDDAPCFYLYSQTWQGQTQVGLLAACSVEEYDGGVIKRHELTRPDKEQDRVDHILHTGTQTGLVFLAYRDEFPVVRAAMAEAEALPLAWRVTTDDGVEHALRVVRDSGLVDRLRAAFAGVPNLYIADGHHRSAAAARVAAARRGEGSSSWFLAGIFPDRQLRVLAYNRLVSDLHGHSAEGLLAAIGQDFDVEAGVAPEPVGRGHFTAYLGGVWYGLRPKEGRVDHHDPVASLDVSVLQDRVLGPLLGVKDPRTDTRIEFVGGIRGASALQAAVDAGRAAVAFHLFPTGLDQLFAVADVDKLMPPKSTWFEPKLRGGVVAHRID